MSDVSGLCELTGHSIVTLSRVHNADVVYHPDVVGSLVKLLSKVLRCSPAGVIPEVIVCSTVRNPETYDSFKRQLGKTHLLYVAPQRKSLVVLVKFWDEAGEGGGGV